MTKVVFLSGQSQGDSLGEIGNSYKAVFGSLGYQFSVIDLCDPTSSHAALIDLMNNSQDIEFAYSWMGYGASITVNDKAGKPRNFWDVINVPFLSLFGDTPAYFFDRHVVDGRSFATLYGFPEHQALRERLPKNNGLVGGFRPFLPLRLSRDQLDFKRKASGQLLFLKNGNDPKKLRQSWNALRPPQLRPLLEIASHLEANLANGIGNQIDDVVTGYFKDRGFDVVELVKLRLFFIAQLDDYLRRLKATMIAEALMEFPVQIRGINWDHLDFSGGRATYVNECNYSETEGLIRDALGVIDMSPNTGLAPHDRPFRAYGAYTLCLTNEQEFFHRHRPPSDTFSFRFEVDSIKRKVADVLARPADYIDLGIDVATYFRKTCPPEAAIGDLIDMAGMVRINQM